MTTINPDLEGVTNKVKTLYLSEWQDNVLNDYTTDETVITAGYGSGKTFIAGLWAYYRLRHNKGTDILWIEPTYKLIKDVAIPTLREALTARGLTEGHHYKVYESPARYEIYFPQLGSIIFLSGENPERIVGYSRISAYVLDEAALMTKQVLDNCVARARTKKAVKIQGLLVSTPEGEGWFSDLYDSDSLPGWSSYNLFKSEVSIKVTPITDKKTGKITLLRTKRVRAETASNQHNLQPNYISKLYDRFSYSSNKIDSYIYGYFRPFTEGLAYTNYKSPLHKIKNIEVDPYRPIHLSFDFNVCPVWVLIQTKRDKITLKSNVDYSDPTQSYKPDKLKYIEKAVIIDNANYDYELLTHSIVEFADKYDVEIFKNTPIKVWGDRSGYSKSHKALDDFSVIKSSLNKLGYKHVQIMADESNPLERHSVNAVNHAFANSQLYVCERSDRILKSLARTCWSGSKKMKLEKPADDTWTHPMDAVKYFICSYLYGGKVKILSGR